MSRKFGPKSGGHPSVGEKCPACKKPFAVGDFTTLVTLGPGDDEEQRQRAREGRPYNAVAVDVHWECSEVAMSADRPRYFATTRLLTGKHVFHGYVYDQNKVVSSCDHAHRSQRAAEACAEKQLHRLDTVEKSDYNDSTKKIAGLCGKF